MTDNKHSKVNSNRRAFLQSSLAVGVASVISTTENTNAEIQSAKTSSKMNPPSEQKMEREVGSKQPPKAVHTIRHAASDLMVQVLRDLKIEYVVTNPGSSFEGLHESIINYGDKPNEMPELITAMHEASAVDMAHGYARSEGKPACALIQGTVGLQNASMAIYQAFHGHTPLVILAGNDEENFLKVHTGEDMAGLVRPFTKWDAQPETVEETLIALQDAYNQSITPPCGPVLVVMNSDLQKLEAGDTKIPVVQPPKIPAISKIEATDVANKLINANNPRLLVGRLRSQEGINDAVKLAELVSASVATRATFGPMSFPQSHPLVGPSDSKDYDFELGLERNAKHMAIKGPHLKNMVGRDAAGIKFGWKENPNLKKVREPDQQYHYDAEVSLPVIIEAVKQQLNKKQKIIISQRKILTTEVNHVSKLKKSEQALESKRPGWNGSPISTARIYAVLWTLIKDLDWCLSSPVNFSGKHNIDLWTHDRPHSYLGVYPAAALGYCLGASMGAGLAAKYRDRIVVNIQGDGDFNYLPGALWSAAHHNLPVLTIMHNNRAYHMEYMYIQYMAGVRGRGTDRAIVGTTFDNPNMDFAQIAKGYGMKSEGPIGDPNKLLAALERGVETVRNGEPYLIDVLTQPR